MQPLDCRRYGAKSTGSMRGCIIVDRGRGKNLCTGSEPLLERPINSMGRARLLDKKSGIWARHVCSMPIYSTAYRANETGSVHSYNVHNANSRGVRGSVEGYPYIHPLQSSPGGGFLVAAISCRQQKAWKLRERRIWEGGHYVGLIK